MPPIPATIDAGTAIPGEPVIKPMSRMSNPAPMVHIGQVKFLSSQFCRVGTWRVSTNHPPKRIKRIPKIRLERFCLIAFLLSSINPLIFYDKRTHELHFYGNSWNFYLCRGHWDVLRWPSFLLGKIKECITIDQSGDDGGTSMGWRGKRVLAWHLNTRIQTCIGILPCRFGEVPVSKGGRIVCMLI